MNRTATSAESSNSPDIRLTARGRAVRRLAIGLIGVAAIVGGREIVNEGVESVGPNHTTTELESMNYVRATAQPGEGAEQMIRRVEPGILASAEDRAEVIDYMINHTGNQDGIVGEGETLHIPVEPGQDVLPGNEIVVR